MSSVAELEAAVRQLPKAELTSFARWLEEYVADAWDQQIQDDSTAGRLDHLIEQAFRDHAAGLTKPL